LHSLKLNEKEEIVQFKFKNTFDIMVEEKQAQPITMAILGNRENYYLFQECLLGNKSAFCLLEKNKVARISPSQEMSLSWFHFLEEDRFIHVSRFHDDMIERKNLINIRTQNRKRFKLAEYIGILRGKATLDIYKIIHS